MDSDDLDDLLDDRKAELEDRFRELEREAEIERLRAQGGGPAREPRPTGAPPETGAPGEDPLADLKSAVEGGEVERYLLVECPHCQGKNRVALSKLRRLNPVCGRCKQELAFIKS